MKTLSAWKRVCAATLAILAVPLALWAQIPGEAWRRIAVLGHDTQCLAFSPAYATDQTIFAGTGGLGVWRSQNGGDTWVQSVNAWLLAHSSVADLAVSPDYPNDHTVFAITATGEVYKSTDADGTLTFTRVKAAPSLASRGTSLAISPNYASDKTVFAGFDGDGLYISTDGGATWTLDSPSLTRLPRILDIAMAPTSTEAILGGVGQDGCLMWRTSGGSWYKIDSGMGDGDADTVLSVLYEGSGRIWVGTQNNGAWYQLGWSSGWNPCWDGTTANGRPSVLSLDRAAGSNPVLMEGRADALYRSTDTGGNGSSAAPSDSAHPVQVVKIAPGWNGTTSCTVFIGTPSGLLRKSCEAPPSKTATTLIDGWAVARAARGTAHFMGSQGQGLFKNVAGSDMVRYNNFPNGQIPEIAAICLDPLYDEVAGYAGGDCLQDLSVLFVAANFPKAPWDNGVYRSDDFGNTWSKMSLGWPTQSITVYDLAISPSYREGGPDSTLYAATSQGVYRWDGSLLGWSRKWVFSASPPAYRVAVPPLYDRAGASGMARHAVFASSDDGTDNVVWFSSDDGESWRTLDYPGAAWGRVTGFAFPHNFGLTTSSSSFFVSAIPVSIGGIGGVFRADYPWTSGYWFNLSGGLGSNPSVWDLAAEPWFLVDNPYRHMVCASDNGIYRTDDAGGTWSWTFKRPAFSVQYDPSDSSGNQLVAGIQALGAAFSDDGGTRFSAFTGYHYLPSDVWATVAHERNPDILFSASPSMGVFVSEDKGLSYRPWNKGRRGTLGPCVLRTGLGINMLSDRRDGAGLGVVWAGTAEEGIKARLIYYNPSTGLVDLETEDGVTPNGWRHCTWYGSGSPITGRWERIEVVPGTGVAYPVWASSPGQGMAALPAGAGWSQWRAQNTGLPSLDTRGMRQGYASPEALPLSSGVEVSGAPAQGNWDYYYLDVPAGTTDFLAFLNDLDDNGPWDADLYVRYGSLPTTSSYDFRPYLNGDETVCHGPQQTLLSEGFDSGIPASWTVVDGGSGGGAAATWTTANPGGRSFPSPFTSPFAIVDSDAAGSGATQDESLITPAVNCRLFDRVVLEFSNYFRWFWYNLNEVADVDVSPDGGATWTNVLRMQGASVGPETRTVDISAVAAGQPSVKVRFHYYNASYEWYWAVDNVRILASRPRAGRWYFGVRGYALGTNPYALTVTLGSGCTSGPEAALPEGTGKAPPSPETAGAVEPKAPHGSTIWGTVTGPGGGVYLGSGDPAGTVTWVARNGVPPTNLTNLMTNTVVQLPDLTLIAGCQGDVFYSPAPDEGRTTWINATSGIASPGSNDMRDLLVASNGDVLIAANGTGSGTAAGGVWLSGDGGSHWMRLSQGFDASTQHVTDLVMDKSTPVQYYASTDGTGVFTRTITASPYPTVTSVLPASGSPDGGETVTITGTGFSNDCPTGDPADCPDSGPVVLFGEEEVPATFVSATELQATVPSHASGAVTVKVRNPDTRRSLTGPSYTYACASPSGLANNTAYDLDPYADTGVRVTWSDPAAWNDGGAGSRSFSVYRNGVLLQAGISPSVHEYTDLTGDNGVSYAYSVRAVNGCGRYADTAGAWASDEYRVPEEVPDTSFRWAGTSKTTLSWSGATGATSYRVYRGNGAEVGNLPSGASACLAYEGAATETGAILASEPAAGEFFWYLVVGVNGAGEGSPGPSRTVTPSGACSPP